MKLSQFKNAARRALSARMAAAQIIWITPQLLIILLIANRGSVELLGTVILALAIYAPIILVLGLNLRNELAVDQAKCLDYQVAILFRAAAAIVSALVAIGILACASTDISAIFIAAAVIGSRIVDQISDISIGAYQRQNETGRIAWSLSMRGLAQIIPLAACIIWPIPILYACAAAFVATAGAASVADWLPAFRTKQSDRLTTRGVELWTLLRPKLGTAPFPALDTIFTNMTKYGAGLFLSLSIVGHIGIAYAIYMPVSIVISSIGYTNLANTIRARDAERPQDIRESLLISMGLALFGIATAIAVTAIAPSYLLAILGIEPDSGGRAILLLTLASLIPQATLGFSCQTLIAIGRRKAYVINPIVGIITFVVLVGFIFGITGKVSVEALMACLFISGFVRLWHGLWHALSATSRIGLRF